MLKKFFAIALLSLFMFPTLASASEQNEWNPTLNATFTPLTEEEIRQNNEIDMMMDLVKNAYMAYYNGEISIDELMTIEKEQYYEVYSGDIERSESEIKAFVDSQEEIKSTKNKLESRLSNSFGNDYSLYAIGDWESKYLPMPYEYQDTIYNCGPASAVNVVNGYNGFAYYNQSEVAKLLGTTTNGTNFGPNWSNVLNGPTMRKTYIRTFGSSYSDWAPVLADRTITTIRSGRGVILDAYMDSSDSYLPGYTSGVIYHYLAGYGFNSTNPSSRTISYIDPNKYNSAAVGAKTVLYQKMAKATKGMGIIT